MAKKRRGQICLILLSFVLMVLTACASKNTGLSTAAPSSASKTITDSTGRKVVVPAKIERVADLWFAHNEVAVMLGAGDKMVATSNTPQAYPWLYKINPSMKKAISVKPAAEFNLEELISAKSDVVFTSNSDKNVDAITNAGIPVVILTFTNFESMKQCIQLTGEVLGPEAVQRANKYNAYLDEKLEIVKRETSKISMEKRPKVLHVTSLSPLTVDGSNTIINDWIEVAGGVNAAAEIDSNNKPVTMEQVLKWNPDIVIFASGIGSIDKVINDEVWKTIPAVKNGKVFLNPNGVFLWDRYGTEEALQIQWAAKTIHPDLFPKLDIPGETKSFYKTFLNYELSDEETMRILTAKKPE